MIPELEQIHVTIGGSAAEALPRYSGVYRFFSEEETLLYIGKSVDIRSRIYAHIQEGRKPGRHQRIMSQVTRIDCQATAGEVGALLIENAAIKQETPLYNRRQRRARRLWTLSLNSDNRGFLVPAAADFLPTDDRQTDCYGLYHNKRHIESSLRRHARDNGLCPRILGLEKGRGPCFQYQLGRCDGACAGVESADEHNARLLSALDRERIAAWPFIGPLALRERTVCPQPGQPPLQYHLVHQWSYLGSYDTLDALRAAHCERPKVLFDRDAYHLLVGALRKGQVELVDMVSETLLDNPLVRGTSPS